MKNFTVITALLAVCAMSAQIFEENFDGTTAGDTAFTQFDNFDVDGDTELWEITDFTGADIELSPIEGFVADSDSWEDGNPNSPMNPDNYLITKDLIDLTGITDGTLTFTFGTPQNNGTFLEDRLAVYASTSNDPATVAGETPIYDQQVGDATPADNGGENSAVDVVLDLSSLAGQSVYLVFRHFDTFDHNSVLLDNIIVDGTLGVDDQDIAGFTHYIDNSATLNVRANEAFVNINLFNLLGQEVVNKSLSSNNETINIAALSAGIYIARVSIENQTQTFKIIKK